MRFFNLELFLRQNFGFGFTQINHSLISQVRNNTIIFIILHLLMEPLFIVTLHNPTLNDLNYPGKAV